MSEPASPACVFAPVARKVQGRVVLRRWLAWLQKTVWPVSIVLALMMLWALRGGASIVAALWCTLALWKIGGLVFAWLRRPGAFSALALWDSAAGRREAFANAWWFEDRREASEAAQRHVEAQKAALTPAMSKLSSDLPLRPARSLLLPLLLVMLGSLISAVRTPTEEILVLDDVMAAKAAEAAKELAKLDLDKKKLAGLKAEEQKQVEDLKAKLEQTAAELADAGGKDAKQVLAELERRARDAEKLAEDLAKGKDDWASDKLVEELRKHADTADLGDAVAAKNSPAAAKAAEKLGDELKSPQISAETKQRLNNTLKEVQDNAEEQDRKRMVGQHVLGAGDQMQKGDLKAAGAEFEQLAEKMRDAALREEAQKQLQQLAEQLRQAGSGITGENQTGAMQELGQNSQQGPQGQNQQSVPQMGQQQGGPQNQQQQQMLAPPGIGQQQQQNQMQQPQNNQGQGQQQQMMMAQPGQQGQPNQQGQPGPPMLVAPVPGQTPMNPTKNNMVIVPGNAPNDPNKPGFMTQSPSSGDKPGVGKSDLNNAPTTKQETAKSDMVQAQQNAEGQATVRSVEGGARKEDAARSATQTTLEAIQAEEAALDEAALPPARREQVRRYFNELRKRFEPSQK
ncbi:MAG: hypothetical protein JNN17_07320 [Verrucomicrobiaceae bacterium]|nr:hypothetical protein [Verrucomicrobiaceae bacterium]